jgi:hypothetical protein
MGSVSQEGRKGRREEGMEADGKDPTDYGLTSFSRGGTKKDRTVAKRAVHPASGYMAEGGTLGRLLRLFDTGESGRDLGESAMQRADLQTLNDRLNELSEALAGKQLSKAALTVWAGVLKDYPIETICDSISQWARSKTKMAAPAEIASICASRYSDALERRSADAKVQFSAGANRILADPRVAREHIARIRRTFGKAGDCADMVVAPTEAELELQRERDAMMSEHLPV